jgi:hypothetical protein
VTKSEQDWANYRTAMRNWYLAGKPKGYEPHVPFQYGSHIDTLPIEVNGPALSSNRLMPIWYLAIESETVEQKEQILWEELDNRRLNLR